MRGPEVLIAALVALGLIASWAAAILPAENSHTNVDAVGRPVMTMVKTPLYYVAHGLEIGSVLAAGLLAALIGGFRTLGIGSRLAFFVLFVNAVVWAGMAYTAGEVLSSEIFGATGPFVWFTLLFVCTGTDRRIWAYIDPVIRLLAYASSGFALRTLIASEYRHFAGFSKYTLYTGLLMWLGGWTLLTATHLRGPRLLLRMVPLMAMGLMAICAQSRSWTILGCLLGLVFVFLRSREQGSIVSGMRTLIVGCVFAAAAAALVYVTMPDTLSDSVNGLSARLNEDSRTGQYTEFFSVVPATDLLLGRGPKGTWYWRGVGEYQYFDNGYLWMLFVGGVPTLLCYLAIVVWPAVRAIRYHPRGADAAAVSLVLLWGLALTGLSTFCLPSIGITNVLVSLWAGRCHLLSAEGGGWELARARGTSMFPARMQVCAAASRLRGPATASVREWNHSLRLDPRG